MNLSIATLGLTRFQTVLEEWEGTPFVSGAGTKGEGTDCIGMVAGVLSELDRERGYNALFNTTRGNRLPPKEILGKLLRKTRLEVLPLGTDIEEGDILCLGTRTRGIVHVAFAGWDSLWQCSDKGVFRAGVELQHNYRVLKTLRHEEKETWYD